MIFGNVSTTWNETSLDQKFVSLVNAIEEFDNVTQGFFYGIPSINMNRWASKIILEPLQGFPGAEDLANLAFDSTLNPPTSYPGCDTLNGGIINSGVWVDICFIVE